MASRSRARQFAVQLVYQNLYSGYDLDKNITLFWQSVKADRGTQEFTEFLVRGMLDEKEELDMEIAGYLKGWTLDRIVEIDRIILELAFFELLYQSDEAPWKVVVDEAVMLGRSFSSGKSATFINGVLHNWAVNNAKQGADELREDREIKREDADDVGDQLVDDEVDEADEADAPVADEQ